MLGSTDTTCHSATSDIIVPGILCTLVLWANYPMTQIYQHDEDFKRGDITLSYRLGIKGTFVFTGNNVSDRHDWFHLVFQCHSDVRNPLWILFPLRDGSGCFVFRILVLESIARSIQSGLHAYDVAEFYFSHMFECIFYLSGIIRHALDSTISIILRKRCSYSLQ